MRPWVPDLRPGPNRRLRKKCTSQCHLRPAHPERVEGRGRPAAGTDCIRAEGAGSGGGITCPLAAVKALCSGRLRHSGTSVTSYRFKSGWDGGRVIDSGLWRLSSQTFPQHPDSCQGRASLPGCSESPLLRELTAPPRTPGETSYPTCTGRSFACSPRGKPHGFNLSTRFH